MLQNVDPDAIEAAKKGIVDMRKDKLLGRYNKMLNGVRATKKYAAYGHY